MILAMSRVRLVGPSARLDEVLGFLQRVGVVHVSAPSGALRPAPPAPSKLTRALRRVLDDVDAAVQLLGGGASRAEPQAAGGLPSSARFARRTRRAAARLAHRREELENERVLLLRSRQFFAAFESLVGHELTWPDGQAFYVVLRAGAQGAVGALRSSLAAAVGDDLELIDRPLASGELAVLILVSAQSAQKVAKLLADAHVQELPAPPGLKEKNLLRAMPALKARLAEIPVQRAQLDADRAALAREAGARLAALRTWLHDQLALLEARAMVRTGAYVFVLEGWVPEPRQATLRERAAAELGPEVVLEVLARERWRSQDAPVVLVNPPIFRPFETITRQLPLPRYGTIDPTPFLAVFFPAFFGVMLGDVGYGALLAVLGAALRRGAAEGSTRRAVSSIALACALFAVLFGLLFGECFGDLGARAGMRPWWFDREAAVVPFLALSVAIGVVHVSLGLLLAMVTAWRGGHAREAAGRGVALVMVLFTVGALLAAFELLPAGLFTPLVVVVVVAFPVLVALEGVVALIEILSTFGHLLSYARIMALGTASLMLAVVANKMVGAMGSVVVGVIFALLFHVVNFAIGLFSPTIHALRLHYVEFFGKFYSPGGVEYRPLAAWTGQMSS